jgi:hypothetical protein
MQLPATSLRSNLGTWAVADRLLPAVAGVLLESLPREAFDPAFVGQDLRTTYFDTSTLDLCRARRHGPKYLTLRLRCYRAGDASEEYALSAKTESQKFRVTVAADTADFLLQGEQIDPVVAQLLPGDLLARLFELIGEQPLLPAACVLTRRYAVEDDRDRLTLDVHVRTDTGKVMPAAILEFKSVDENSVPPAGLTALRLRPIKLSKFLWATEV